MPSGASRGEYCQVFQAKPTRGNTEGTLYSESSQGARPDPASSRPTKWP